MNLPDDLTDKELREIVWRIYRMLRPIECPFCESNNIKILYGDGECYNCNREWSE